MRLPASSALLLLAGLSLALPASGAAQRPPSITLERPLGGVIRVGQTVTVAGAVDHAPERARAALELKRIDRWAVEAKASLRRGGAFTLRWTVRGSGFSAVSLRVVALNKHGRVVAATPVMHEIVGPAPVYCAPPGPPGGVAVGDGWIVGGAYGEGGPAPGIDACLAQAYTVTATSQGHPVASEHVAGGHSYTLVVPAGSYELSAGACRGQAVVSAGKQTTANAICAYP